VGFGVVARLDPDHGLKGIPEFADVVEQSGDPGPLARAERVGETSGPLCHTLEMIAQLVAEPVALVILPDMGQPFRLGHSSLLMSMVPAWAGKEFGINPEDDE
jgi:hypothetical protein